jgi:hypothetical protein
MRERFKVGLEPTVDIGIDALFLEYIPYTYNNMLVNINYL